MNGDAECARHAAQDALGKQALSDKTSAPSYGMGSGVRKSLATKTGVPGPGAYKVRCAIAQRACRVSITTTDTAAPALISAPCTVRMGQHGSECRFGPVISRRASL